MATILNGVSRTFAEYLLIPRLTRKDQSGMPQLCRPQVIIQPGSGLIRLLYLLLCNPSQARA